MNHPLTGTVIPNYGDSWANEFGVVGSGFPSQVVDYYDATLSQRAVSGSRLMQTGHLMMQQGTVRSWAPADRARAGVVIHAGLNDVRLHDLTDPAMVKWLNAAENSLRVALALIASRAQVGWSTGTYAGSPAWNSITYALSHAGNVAYTTAPAGSVTFQVADEDHVTLLIGGHVTQVGAVAELYVDGALVRTVPLGNEGANHADGIGVGWMAERVAVGPGAHSVMVKKADATADALYVDGYLLPAAVPPNAWVVEPQYLSAAAWDMYPPHDQGSDAGVDVLRSMLAAVTAEFPNAHHVSPAALVYPADYQADQVHPTASGHSKIANALIAQLDAYTVAVTAAVQATEPPRVLVSVTGLDPLRPATLYRLTDGERVPVRGTVGVMPSGSGTLVIVDNSAPFGVPVSYEVEQPETPPTSSNEVTLTTSAPWITHPITGQGVSATIVEWSELNYSTRQTVVPVAGRRAPIVVSDVRSAPSSEVVLLTRTRAALRALRELLATGDVVQIRPVCGAVEEEFVAVGEVVERRYKPASLKADQVQAGSDWRRLVSMAVQAVDEPALQTPALGDTLEDLHTYEPGTLADIAATWPSPATLLTIAQTHVGAA